MSELYRNYGMELLNDAPCPEEATLIVVGVPRSGTSMIAVSLISLGVPMGDKMDDVVYEDAQMAGALKKPEVLERVIAQRNAMHAKWGFKRPMAFETMPRDLHLFRNPRFIIPFRDPVAIAMRNVVSVRFDFLPALGLAARQNLQLAEFVRTTEAPMMLVSYEKALRESHLFLETLSKFCGIKGMDFGPALDRIMAGPPAYLEKARLKD